MDLYQSRGLQWSKTHGKLHDAQDELDYRSRRFSVRITNGYHKTPLSSKNAKFWSHCITTSRFRASCSGGCCGTWLRLASTMICSTMVSFVDQDHRRRVLIVVELERRSCGVLAEKQGRGCVEPQERGDQMKCVDGEPSGFMSAVVKKSLSQTSSACTWAPVTCPCGTSLRLSPRHHQGLRGSQHTGRHF